MKQFVALFVVIVLISVLSFLDGELNANAYYDAECSGCVVGEECYPLAAYFYRGDETVVCTIRGLEYLRPINANCGQDYECASGVCWDGECVALMDSAPSPSGWTEHVEAYSWG